MDRLPDVWPDATINSDFYLCHWTDLFFLSTIDFKIAAVFHSCAHMSSSFFVMCCYAFISFYLSNISFHLCPTVLVAHDILRFNQRNDTSCGGKKTLLKSETYVPHVILWKNNRLLLHYLLS